MRSSYSGSVIGPKMSTCTLPRMFMPAPWITRTLGIVLSVRTGMVRILPDESNRSGRTPARRCDSRRCPELASGEPGTLRQGGELQPYRRRVDVVESGARGGEATIGAGDDVLPSHDPGEADDALGDQLGVLHQVGGVADHARDQDHPGRRLPLLEHMVLVLVPRIGRLEREGAGLDPE